MIQIARTLESVERESTAARFDTAVALYANQRTTEAIECFEQVLAVEPAHFDALIQLGRCRLDGNDPAAAEALFRRAIVARPESAVAWTNLGLTLVHEDRHREAIEAFDHAYDLERRHGDDGDAYVNLGVALADEGRVEEAFELFESNLALRPAAKGHWNFAVALLRSGRLVEGWPHHEFRWLLEPLLSLRPNFGIPVWAGQDLRGKTLLVRAEQGLGDTIQMLRYIPALATLGARVLLRALPGIELLASGIKGCAEVLEKGAANPPFDYYVHAMSLPGVFRTSLESIPADVPYLDADPARRERWRNRLGTTTKRAVGLVWAGSPTHVNDRIGRRI